jgi:hypothetical protein
MRYAGILRAAARQVVFSNERAIEFLNESVTDKKPSSDKTFDIFLSYRADDADVVMGVYADLIKRGYAVYIDRIMDPDLNRKDVTRQTADTIRNRLMQSKSLFYVASDNAAQSNWMPWELGFEDGYRAKSAIVPVTDKSRYEFVGVEFVGIYPRVSPAPSMLLVHEPTGELLGSFETWRDSIPKRNCGMPKCPLPPA